MDGMDVNKRDTASGWSPLLRAASVGGNNEVAQLLIKYKADVNLLDNDNKSALMIAVINGNQPFVQTLVENGADIKMTNEYGKTSFEMAVSMERRVSFCFDILNFLILKFIKRIIFFLFLFRK